MAVFQTPPPPASDILFAWPFINTHTFKSHTVFLSNFHLQFLTTFPGIIACLLVFLACGVMMPIFVFIPKTVLGAMIAMAVITMFDYKTPMRIWKVRKIDLLPYFVSFFGTFYTLETGVLSGAVVSLLLMVSHEVSMELYNKYLVSIVQGLQNGFP